MFHRKNGRMKRGARPPPFPPSRVKCTAAPPLTGPPFPQAEQKGQGERVLSLMEKGQKVRILRAGRISAAVTTKGKGMNNLDIVTFLQRAGNEVAATPLTVKQIKLLDVLVQTAISFRSLIRQHVAYILATAFHETDRFKAMEEYASGAAYEGRADLGNVKTGDGVRFKGRGFPMLTGRENYRVQSLTAGVDLIENPFLASDPAISALITVHGMIRGDFTGVGLGKYIRPGKIDFINARRVINGTDRAAAISVIAQAFDELLEKCGWHDPFLPPVASMLPAPSTQTVTPEPVVVAKKPRVAQAMACGSSVTVLLTAIAATGWLPPELSTPEVMTAAVGLLTTLAAAAGLCRINPYHSKPDET